MEERPFKVPRRPRIFSREKKEEESQRGEGSLGDLQKFSEDLMKLGKDVAEKFEEKKMLEKKIAGKQKELAVLQREVYDLREKLIRVSTELSKLEEKRKEMEES